METPADDNPTKAPYNEAKASKFTFKSKSERHSKRHRRHREEESDQGGPSDRKRSRREHRHKHKRSSPGRDRHSTSTRDGSYYDPDSRHRESLFDNLDDNEATTSGLDHDDAFRESLFDALADDEGAAYWEGVYGQPIHTYSDTKPGPDGKLERMTDEEYADYVRGKMWEKSHQHILEEREAKERARKERKAQQQHSRQETLDEEKEREHLRQQMEESLKRGAERNQAKEMVAAWERYEKGWDDLRGAPSTSHETAISLQKLVPWPVMSGRMRDVSKDEIEHFLRASPAWKDNAVALLKIERVRWHPDKMQQRFGQHMDSETMKSVTAVFQIIDRLWNEHR